MGNPLVAPRDPSRPVTAWTMVGDGPKPETTLWAFSIWHFNGKADRRYDIQIFKKEYSFFFQRFQPFFFFFLTLFCSWFLVSWEYNPIDWLGHPNTTSWKAVQENLTINISIILTSSHLLSLSPWCHHFKAIVLLILARNLWKLVEFSGLCESSHLSWSVSICIWWTKASLVAQVVKNLPAMQETWVQSLGWKDPL